MQLCTMQPWYQNPELQSQCNRSHVTPMHLAPSNHRLPRGRTISDITQQAAAAAAVTQSHKMPLTAAAGTQSQSAPWPPPWHRPAPAAPQHPAVPLVPDPHCSCRPAPAAAHPHQQPQQHQSKATAAPRPVQPCGLRGHAPSARPPAHKRQA